ncbi:MAG: mechanosensitive ion channel domain-containing protein [Steroidobacteraceae bacterium]
MSIIAGGAGEKTLANLIARFQIALAQPIRLNDVVIVEGEWGRVEEIILSYVDVHIWDDRRLVLPLTYFVEKPFQNWTRNSAQLLGSVFVWVDYSFPLEERDPREVHRLHPGASSPQPSGRTRAGSGNAGARRAGAHGCLRRLK